MIQMPRSCKCILDRAVFKGAMSEKDRDKILRNLKGIEWHPYPKEKPKENESYLVTYEGYITGNSYVNISRYFWDGFVHRRVTAWAELPKPDEEGAEE